MPQFCTTKAANRSRCIRHLVTALAFVVPWQSALVNAELLDFSSDDSVIIKADSAWEDATADVVHFSGGFTLRAPDWYVSADTAVVYGKLDDPDKVQLNGNPASIFFLRTGSDADNPTRKPGEPADRTEGTATDIEYLRSTNIVKLSGSATLKRGEDVLVSEKIEYDVDADRYTASGTGGVNIQIKADR